MQSSFPSELIDDDASFDLDIFSPDDVCHVGDSDYDSDIESDEELDAVVLPTEEISLEQTISNVLYHLTKIDPMESPDLQREIFETLKGCMLQLRENLSSRNLEAALGPVDYNNRDRIFSAASRQRVQPPASCRPSIEPGMR